MAQGAPAAPVLVVLGATYALAGDDKAALTAWNQARDAGIDDASVATLLVDAYMRQGDVARATAMARAALDAQPDRTRRPPAASPPPASPPASTPRPWPDSTRWPRRPPTLTPTSW